MFLWYFFTIVYNIANKNALNAFPLPAVVSTLQLMVGLPLFLPLWIVKRPALKQSDFTSFFIMSLMHAFGIFSSVVALEAGSVSFTHIIKASEPVFAAIFSTLLLGQQTSLPVYLSLLPIIGGVGFASLTDFKFSPRAFFPAILSNIFYQLRIVLSKKFMLKSSNQKSSLTPSEMFQTLTVVSILLLTPIALFLEGNLISAAWATLNSASSSSESLKSFLHFPLPFPLSEGAKHFIANILISGLSFSLYNEVIFYFVCLILIDWLPALESHSTCELRSRQYNQKSDPYLRVSLDLPDPNDDANCGRVNGCNCWNTLIFLSTTAETKER
jgi:drug/metabolite transporter (DMT)-like permease